jgi:hypothetical protein
MRKFKVQYCQVFEYEIEAADLDAAARSVQAQVQPEYDPGYIKVLSIEEVGSTRTSACDECKAKVWPESRFWQWPKKVDKSKAKK